MREISHSLSTNSLICATLLAGTLPSCQVKEENPNLPNIILMVADDP